MILTQIGVTYKWSRTHIVIEFNNNYSIKVACVEYATATWCTLTVMAVSSFVNFD